MREALSDQVGEQAFAEWDTLPAADKLATRREAWRLPGWQRGSAVCAGREGTRRCSYRQLGLMQLAWELHG
jgi:hypothetical protein